MCMHVCVFVCVHMRMCVCKLLYMCLHFYISLQGNSDGVRHQSVKQKLLAEVLRQKQELEKKQAARLQRVRIRYFIFVNLVKYI